MLRTLKTYKLLSGGDFVPIGVISLKYNVHRSTTMHYHKSKGAVRWQQRGKQIYVLRQDCENLFSKKKYIM